VSLGPLLRKELRWGRHKLTGLAVALVLVPAAFAYAALAFQTVLPTDAPIAVVAGSDAVTTDDISVTKAAVTFFSSPRVYADSAAAFEALARERVYAVITVPAGVTDPSNAAAFDVAVSGSVVPYHEASKAVVSVLDAVLRDQLPGTIRVQRTIVGPERTLSEYLLPTFTLVLVMLVALIYLPYVIVSEAGVVDRLRLEGSLAAALAAKLAVFAGLLLVPVAVFAVVGGWLDYGVAVVTPGAVLTYLFTFLGLGGLATAVTVATGFSTTGRFLNVLVLFFLLTFSGLLYPAGFFSPIRRELVRVMPTHYAAVALRGFTLRDAPVGEYAGWLAGLAVFAVVGLALLWLAVYARRWRT
jgi:ABC-2 type transport system permease protein